MNAANASPERSCRPIFPALLLLLLLPVAAGQPAAAPADSPLRRAESSINRAPAQALDIARRLLAAGPVDVETRVRALNVLARASLNLFDRQAAMGYARQALETAEKNHLPEQTGQVLLSLALVHKEFSEPRQGLALATRSHTLFVALGDERLAAEAQLTIATMHTDLGQYEEALRHLRQGLAVARRLGDERLLAISFNGRGNTYYYMGMYDKALDDFLRGLRLYEKMGDGDRAAACQGSIGLLYISMGDYDQALQYHERSRRTRQRLGNRPGLARILSNIAYTCWRKGDWENMLANARDALAICNELGDQALSRFPLINIGVALLEKGELARATPFLERGLAISRQMGDPRNEAISLKFLARIRRQGGRPDEALPLARQALSILQAIKSRDEERRVLRELTLIAVARGDFRSAFGFQLQVQEISDALSAQHIQNRLAGLRLVHETASREREIELLKSSRSIQDMELQRQKLLRNGILAGALLLLGIVVLLVSRYRMKLRINESLQVSHQRLLDISLTDPLTGMKNRRFLAQTIPGDISQALRHHTYRNRGQTEPPPREIDIGFLLLDLDHFKTVNDNFGQEAGDVVLMQLRDILEKACRKSDLLVRWGGEELLVVARFTIREELPAMAERIRRAVAEHRFLLASGREIYCTVSIGFASFPFVPQQPEAVGWELVVLAADQALTLAKADGRNTWFGLQATATTPVGNLAGRIRNELPAMIEAQEISVLHRLARTGPQALATPPAQG